MAYAPVTGFYSLQLLEHRPGARRGHDPQRLRRAAVRPAAGRLLHRPRPRAAATSSPPSTRRCSRPRGTRCSRAATGRARVRWSRSNRPPARSWRWCRRRPTTRTCWPPTTCDEQAQAWEQLRDDPNSPLLNRAISRDLPAGLHVQGHHHRGRAAGRRHPEHPGDRGAANPVAGQHRDAGELRRLVVRRRADGVAAGGVRDVLQHRVRRARHRHRRRRPARAPRRRSASTSAPAPIPLQVAESTVGPDPRRRRARHVEHRPEGRRAHAAAERDDRRDHRQRRGHDAALPGRQPQGARPGQHRHHQSRRSSAGRCRRRSRLHLRI